MNIVARLARSYRRREGGMSLIEVLIAVLIMVVIALGILPLFSRSVRQNREGANYTDITNVARSALEEYLRLDFNAPEMTLPGGSTQLFTKQVYDRQLQRWVDSTVAIPAPANAAKPHLYERWIVIQQFTSGDFTSDGYLDDPKPGNTDRMLIQLKRIRVTVRPLWKSELALGNPMPFALETVKAI